MPAPLNRYTAEEVGIQDGGLFAFVIGNVPELLLLLDAIREGEAETSRWQCSLARMSSSKEIVRFDDKEIWSIPNIYREPVLRKPTAAYSETAPWRRSPRPTLAVEHFGDCPRDLCESFVTLKVPGWLKDNV